MTAPQIQIACVKACGWKNCRDDADAALALWTNPSTSLVGTPPCNQTEGWETRMSYWLILPYTTSHDAMAEALGTMTEEEWDNYVAFLGSETGIIYTKKMLRATPLQQAVAFLKTKNLYTQ